ncbi:hypothetical protein T4C_2715 [Trichinella pseudospiralis]|uniref:Uncharacterized protein n=1 Tax=Trichinella pseudospiralis TaxID=6337 RepID=A0A0V1JPA1_TRIPS|nr:hypothetical protein T4C_2715 [Trichinella pseudospiralis]
MIYRDSKRIKNITTNELNKTILFSQDCDAGGLAGSFEKSISEMVFIFFVIMLGVRGEKKITVNYVIDGTYENTIISVITPSNTGRDPWTVVVKTLYAVITDSTMGAAWGTKDFASCAELYSHFMI